MSMGPLVMLECILEEMDKAEGGSSTYEVHHGSGWPEMDPGRVVDILV